MTTPLVDDELRVEDDPRGEDIAALNDHLYEHNAAITGWHNGRSLAIFVRDGKGTIDAGLHGWTWGHTGFVQTLWVRDDLRRRGLGRRLLSAAEQEAIRRGCREMHLDTHSYQAPQFYLHLGYKQIGVLPGWPGASMRLFFMKRLSPAETPTARASGDG